jgi:hypothetical protein
MGVLVDAQAARARKAFVALRTLMPPLLLLPPPFFTRQATRHPRAPLHTIFVRAGRRARPHVVVVMVRRWQLGRRRARMRVIEAQVEPRQHRRRLRLSRTQRRARANRLVVRRKLGERRRGRGQRARERRKVVQDRRRVCVWRRWTGCLRPADRAATRTSHRRVRRPCGQYIRVLMLRGVGVQGGAGAPARTGVRRRAAVVRRCGARGADGEARRERRAAARGCGRDRWAGGQAGKVLCERWRQSGRRGGVVGRLRAPGRISLILGSDRHRVDVVGICRRLPIAGGGGRCE